MVPAITTPFKADMPPRSFGEVAHHLRSNGLAACPGFAVIGHIEDLRGNVTRGFCLFSKISRRGILPKVRHTTRDILIEIIVMIR